MTSTKETAVTERKRQFSADRILQLHQPAADMYCHVLTYRQLHRLVGIIINNNK